MKFFIPVYLVIYLMKVKDISPEFSEKGGYNVVNSNAV